MSGYGLGFVDFIKERAEHMSKAVLVMDMPEKCDGCILHSTMIRKQICNAEIKRTENEGEKPDWCPLRELPEKKPIRKDDELSGLSVGLVILEAASLGWNDCIDAITGGKG